MNVVSQTIFSSQGVQYCISPRLLSSFLWSLFLTQTSPTIAPSRLHAHQLAEAALEYSMPTEVQEVGRRVSCQSSLEVQYSTVLYHTVGVDHITRRALIPGVLQDDHKKASVPTTATILVR
jgi:hypothetical protein